MRRPIIIISLLVLSAAVVGAQAQPGHGPGGGHPAGPPAAAAPHPAPAPAPHMAAPAPAAPHFAPPHMAAPQIAHPAPPHLAAPHFARPAPSAPHVAMPRAAQPHMHPPHFAQRPSVRPSPPRRAFAQHGFGARGTAGRGSPLAAHAEHRVVHEATPSASPREQQIHAQQPGSPEAGRNAGIREQAQPAHGPAGAHNGPAGPATANVSPEPRNPAQPSARVTSRVNPQAARQGRFAAPFVSRSLQSRALALPVRDALRRNRRAAFVAWAGPVFWPFVYTDLFYYAFWPTAYDDGYWAYAYDDLVDGTFWASNDPYAAYAYAGPNPATAGLTETNGRGSRVQGGPESTQQAIRGGLRPKYQCCRLAVRSDPIRDQS